MEMLEGESIERHAAEIRAELEHVADDVDAAVANELREWLRLQRSKHENLEREHGLAQERAEAWGVNLAE